MSGTTFVDFTTPITAGWLNYVNAHAYDKWHPVSVKDYGAIGNGVADDTAALSAALASGAKEIYFPDGVYTISSAITIPADVRLRGANRRTTEIRKAFNGNLFTLSDGAQIDGLYLNGQGATYTGRGLVIGGTDGNQIIRNSRIEDFESYCVEFSSKAAGSRSVWDDVVIWRTGGSSAGKYAVKIEDGAQLTAVPRKWSKIETAGFKFIDLGGCNDFMMTDSFVGEMLMSANSRGVMCAASRIGVNESAMDVRGLGVYFVGCNFAPAITVTSGTVPVGIVGCGFNNGITDVTTNSENVIAGPGTAYTPTWTSSGTAPAIGNGTLRGHYSRTGSAIVATIEMIAGSTTTFGTGTWSFSLPRASAGATVHVGTGYARDDSASGAATGVFCINAAGGTTVVCQATGTGQFSATVPITWAQSDSLRLTIAYPL